jgi:tRNA threonylcarbamoyladenosine biosynthesis protein TsaB
MQRGQDARLMPMIVETVAKSSHAFPDFDRIAVTRGPGSFTGVRVGLAAARGIGLATGKPVIGIDRFAVYRALHPGGNLLAVIDSKRAELFCKFFPASGAAHEACLMTEPQITEFLAAHPETAVAGDLASSNDDAVACCALLAAQADAQNPDFQPQPLYLRAPDVTLSSAISR